MGEEGRKFLSNDKKQKKHKEKNAPKMKNRTTYDTNHQVAVIINSVMQATRNESAGAAVPISGTIPLPSMPLNSSHVRPPTSIDQSRKILI